MLESGIPACKVQRIYLGDFPVSYRKRAAKDLAFQPSAWLIYDTSSAV